MGRCRIENLALKAGDDLIWLGWFQFGDWLALNAPTLSDLVATAYFARSTQLLVQIADVLGKREDAERYRTRWEAIRCAFVAVLRPARRRHPARSAKRGRTGVDLRSAARDTAGAGSSLPAGRPGAGAAQSSLYWLHGHAASV